MKKLIIAALVAALAACAPFSVTETKKNYHGAYDKGGSAVSQHRPFPTVTDEGLGAGASE